MPPALAGENLYVFPNSSGYGGQMYHYVAHDPFLRTDIWRYMDNARVRYRRILLPAVAFLPAARGRPSIDRAYTAANVLLLFLGAWRLSRDLDSPGRQPHWGVLFVLMPATLISLDRLTGDPARCALLLADSRRQCGLLEEPQHAPEEAARAAGVGAYCAFPRDWDRGGASVCDFSGPGVEDLYIAEYCCERCRA